MSLLRFCDTDRQRQVVALVEQVGVEEASRQLATDRRGIQRIVKRLREIAAERTGSARGIAPGCAESLPEPLSDGQVLAGTTTLYKGAESDPWALRWVRAKVSDEQRQLALEATIDALKATIPRADPVPAPSHTAPDLMNVAVVTDFHLGAYAWAEETGSAWDSDIAEKLLVDWFAAAIARAPAAEHGVLAQLGDFLHYDSLESVTPTSRHQLDSDTRYQRVVRVAIRALRRVIAMMLEKHARLTVIMAEGNHDIAGSAWLREAFSAFYADDPRVTVETSPDPYYAVEHGKCAVFFHHGHLKKFAEVDRVFAAKFRDLWGRTQHAYAHLGHYHHRREIESALMLVRQHRTLAARDAYASRGGWMSGREAQVITYHREHGEVQTLSIRPEAA